MNIEDGVTTSVTNSWVRFFGPGTCRIKVVVRGPNASGDQTESVLVRKFTCNTAYECDAAVGEAKKDARRLWNSESKK